MPQNLKARYMGNTTDDFVFGKTYEVVVLKDIEEHVQHSVTFDDIIQSLEGTEKDIVKNVWHVVNEKKELVKLINANHLFTLIHYSENPPLSKTDLNTLFERAIEEKASGISIISNNSEDIILFHIGKRCIDFSSDFPFCDDSIDKKPFFETIIEKCGISNWNKEQILQKGISMPLKNFIVDVRIQIISTKTINKINCRFVSIHAFKTK